MKHTLRLLSVTPGALVLAVVMACLPAAAFAQQKVVDKIADAQQPKLSPADKKTIRAFDRRVKQYVRLRERVKARAPKLKKDSSPEEIQVAETAFITALRNARSGAKPGDLFTADIARYIRATLRTEFQPTDKKEIRKVVLDKESTIPVPLKVNYPYPDPKEFVEMPATLLLKLPPLPKQLKYRYVGRNLMLIDTDNNMIVDFMLDALP